MKTILASMFFLLAALSFTPRAFADDRDDRANRCFDLMLAKRADLLIFVDRNADTKPQNVYTLYEKISQYKFTIVDISSGDTSDVAEDGSVTETTAHIIDLKFIDNPSKEQSDQARAFFLSLNKLPFINKLLCVRNSGGGSRVGN